MTAPDFDTDKLLEAADTVEKFVKFISIDYYKRTIFYASDLVRLMRKVAKQEHPMYWEKSTSQPPSDTDPV
jgi:hypothetical protein